MKIVKWLKKVLRIHSPSKEMKQHEAEVAYYIGLYAYKMLGAIESVNMVEEDNDEKMGGQP